MQFFFILGREPALSAAEIIALCAREYAQQTPPTSPKVAAANFGEGLTDLAQGTMVSREVLITGMPEALDPHVLMRELGGTVKIGHVQKEWNELPDETELLGAARDAIIQVTKALPRALFGFSGYDASGRGLGVKELKNFRKMLHGLGIKVKRTLGKERKVRFVTSREPTLSSVTVELNKLVKEGVEIVFLINGRKLLLGRTIVVQPFRELEERDYGRPARDAESGMLPPKLARALLNLARVPATATVLDPFCGSGTILTEAWLLGYRALIASDIDSTAIARTRSNLEWTDPESTRTVRLVDSGVKQLPGILEPASVDAIVTEPYLGPPLTGRERREDIEEIEKQLQPLFHDMLTSFRVLLKPHGVAVVAFPLWPLSSRGHHWIHSSILDQVTEYGLTFRTPLPLTLVTPALAPEFGAGGKTLLYGRPDQRVWREIAILEKR